jgi:Putative auto-transporter adhesin, head GIN domain
MSRFAVLTLGLFWLHSSWAETITVTDLSFDSVELNGSSELEVSQGDQVELVLRGSSSDLDKQPFYLSGDRLVLGRTKRSGSSANSIQYKLTVPSLRHLELNGSGEVYVKPMELEDFTVSLEGSGEIKLFEIRGRNVTLRLSGSGDIQLASVIAKDLQVVLSGSGDINIGDIETTRAEFSLNGSGDIDVQGDGSAAEVEVNVIGSGDIEIQPLLAQEMAVHIMGSGTAMVNVETQLIVNTVGSGDVGYRGNPTIESTIVGSGDVYLEH